MITPRIRRTLIAAVAAIVPVALLTLPAAAVVTLPAKHLDMDESTTKAVVGKIISVDVKDLAPGEPYSITLGGIGVASGNADSKGRVKTTVGVPTLLPLGKTHIEVVGSNPSRSDTDAFTVTKPGKLDVDLGHSSVKVGKTQKLKVEGLHPNVEVTIEGEDFTLSLHVADNSGKYSITFPVGTPTGTHSVKVTDSFDGRSSTKTFKVK